MNKVKSLFLTQRWPWHVLTGLCILLGIALLLRKKPGCVDIVVLNNDLSALAMHGQLLPMCLEPGQGGWRTKPALPDEEQLVISEEEIEERLDDAGAEADGKMTISLAWNTTDDLDLHVYEPSGQHIYHASRNSSSGGRLDVDANDPNSALGRTPVENVFWDAPPHGHHVDIVSYNLNETDNGSRLPATMRIVNNGMTEMRELNLVVRQRPANQGGEVIESFSVIYP